MTPQELGIVGAIAGGVFAVVNGAIGLAKDAIAKRNGASSVLTESERRALYDTARRTENVEELVKSNTALAQQLATSMTVLTERFTSHIGEFRCLAEKKRGLD